MAALMQLDLDEHEEAVALLTLPELQIRAQRYLEEQHQLRLTIERRRVSVIHQKTLQMRYKAAEIAEVQAVERLKTLRARQQYDVTRDTAAREMLTIPPPPPEVNNARQRRRNQLNQRAN